MGTTTTTTTTRPTADPYFTHYDPRDEHDAYKEAERRFEEHHRAKVSKVMKDWSDLEEKYQGMREKDPSAAEDFKKKMTERFQKTVQALKEESSNELLHTCSQRSPTSKHPSGSKMLTEVIA